MKYTVENISLRDSLAKYNVKSLDELTDDELVQFCHDELRESHVPKTDAKGKVIGMVKRRGDKKNPGTIDSILRTTSVTFSVGSEYWDSEVLKLAEEMEFDELVKHHETGEETFGLLSSLGVAVFKLEYGKKVEGIFLPSTYIREVLVGSAYAKRCEFTDEDGNKYRVLDGKWTNVSEIEGDVKVVKEEVATESLKDPKEDTKDFVERVKASILEEEEEIIKDIYTDMNMDQMKIMAKGFSIKGYHGMSEDTLRKSLRDHQDLLSKVSK